MSENLTAKATPTYPPPGGYGEPGGNGRVVHALGAVVVTCYGEPECLERLFTSSDIASDPLLLDAQLREAQWQIAANAQGKIFRCPLHALVRVPLVERGPKEFPRQPRGRAAGLHEKASK